MASEPGARYQGTWPDLRHGDDRVGALLDRLVARVGVQVGGGVARVDAVDAHPRQRPRVLRGEHVHRALGRRVGQGGEGALDPARRRGHRERAEPARDVDDHGRGGALEQRQERVGDAHDAGNVRGEDLLEVGRGRLGDGRDRAGDPRVVDEDVELADRLGRRGDRRVVGDVELDEAGAERVGGGLAALGSRAPIQTSWPASRRRRVASWPRPLFAPVISVVVMGTRWRSGRAGTRGRRGPGLRVPG